VPLAFRADYGSQTGPSSDLCNVYEDISHLSLGLLALVSVGNRTGGMQPLSAVSV